MNFYVLIGLTAYITGGLWLAFILYSDNNNYSFGAKIFGAVFFYAFDNIAKCWFPLLISLVGIGCLIYGLCFFKQTY